MAIFLTTTAKNDDEASEATCTISNGVEGIVHYYQDKDTKRFIIVIKNESLEKSIFPLRANAEFSKKIKDLLRPKNYTLEEIKTGFVAEVAVKKQEQESSLKIRVSMKLMQPDDKVLTIKDICSLLNKKCSGWRIDNVNNESVYVLEKNATSDNKSVTTSVLYEELENYFAEEYPGVTLTRCTEAQAISKNTQRAAQNISLSRSFEAMSQRMNRDLKQKRASLDEPIQYAIGRLNL